MKRITWKRWMCALGALAVGCCLFLLTEYLIFFVSALAAFFIILIANYIG